MKAIFLCDFDGTITEQDVYDRILDNFATGDWETYGHAYDVNQITFEAMNTGFVNSLMCTQDSLAKFISEYIRIRPGFVAFQSFLKERNISFAILSGGLDLYIRAILPEESLYFVDSVADLECALDGSKGIPVLCNKVFEKDGGGYNFVCHPVKNDRWAPDKAFIAKHLKKKFQVPVIYAGDGASDYDVAEVADFVFATSALVEHCKKKSIGFHSFANFNDVKDKIPEIKDDY